MRYRDDVLVEFLPGKSRRTAPDQQGTLMGLRMDVQPIHAEVIYVDENVSRDHVYLGPVELADGALLPGEVMMHPQSADLYSLLGRKPSQAQMIEIFPGKEPPVTNPSDVPRTRIDQRVIDQHTEWMRDNAGGLRLLDNRQGMPPNAFANEALRQQVIKDLGAQMALDAFKRGLGILALSEPLYFVQRYMGAWMDPSKPVPSDSPGWLPAPPPTDMIETDALILIKIEAYGFPIGRREV